MPTPTCANCGLPLVRQLYRSKNGLVHCCQRCAERGTCRCRELVLAGAPAVGNGSSLADRLMAGTAQRHSIG
jgi:hypothetical protein